MNKPPTLYLMFGYPGAGKTTASDIIQSLTGAVHLSSDRIRLELFPHPEFTPVEHHSLYRLLDQRTETLLGQGKSVIYDANLNRHTHRASKYILCKHLGVTPVLIWLQTPIDLSKQRALHESRQPLWHDNETPSAMFDRVAGALEEPTQHEPYIRLDGTKITPAYIKQQMGL
jgi:predicted kinase